MPLSATGGSVYLPVIDAGCQAAAVATQHCRLLFLVVLHVRGERRGRVVAAIADGALEWFLVVVRLHVDLQVITV